jgi:hypothetical protein
MSDENAEKVKARAALVRRADSLGMTVFDVQALIGYLAGGAPAVLGRALDYVQRYQLPEPARVPGDVWSWTAPAEPPAHVRRLRPAERYPGDSSIWYDREYDPSGWRGVIHGRPGGVISWLQVVAGAGDVYGDRTLFDATAERDAEEAHARGR